MYPSTFLNSEGYFTRKNRGIFQFRASIHSSGNNKIAVQIPGNTLCQFPKLDNGFKAELLLQHRRLLIKPRLYPLRKSQFQRTVLRHLGSPLDISNCVAKLNRSAKGNIKSTKCDPGSHPVLPFRQQGRRKQERRALTLPAPPH